MCIVRRAKTSRRESSMIESNESNTGMMQHASSILLGALSHPYKNLYPCAGICQVYIAHRIHDHVSQNKWMLFSMDLWKRRNVWVARREVIGRRTGSDMKIIAFFILHVLLPLLL